MAQNTVKTLTADTWTQLTDADVTALTFMVRQGTQVYIAGTVGAVAPSDLNSAIPYAGGQGERNASLSDLFPGIAATRVYAYPIDEPAQVFVSHA